MAKVPTCVFSFNKLIKFLRSTVDDVDAFDTFVSTQLFKGKAIQPDGRRCLDTLKLVSDKFVPNENRILFDFVVSQFRTSKNTKKQIVDNSKTKSLPIERSIKATSDKELLLRAKQPGAFSSAGRMATNKPLPKVMSKALSRKQLNSYTQFAKEHLAKGSFLYGSKRCAIPHCVACSYLFKSAPLLKCDHKACNNVGLFPHVPTSEFKLAHRLCAAGSDLKTQLTYVRKDKTYPNPLVGALPAISFVKAVKEPVVVPHTAPKAVQRTADVVEYPLPRAIVQQVSFATTAKKRKVLQDQSLPSSGLMDGLTVSDILKSGLSRIAPRDIPFDDPIWTRSSLSISEQTRLRESISPGTVEAFLRYHTPPHMTLGVLRFLLTC